MKYVKNSRRAGARRRRKQKILVLLVLTVCILLGASALLNTGGAADVPQYIEVMVQPGDTLWKIARNHLPAGMDVRKFIFLIEKANGISNSMIYPGDILLLPM